MLEDLPTGIHGCRLLYYEYAEHSDVDVDDEVDETLDDVYDQVQAEFRNAVREEARAHLYRLGLEPAPSRPTRPALRLIANEGDDADDGDRDDGDRDDGDRDDGDRDDGDEDCLDIDLEAEDTREQVVSAVSDAGDPDIPRQLLESMLEVANDDIGRVIAAMIARGLGSLVAMRDGPLTTADIDAAVDWLGSEYNGEYADPALVVASLAGHYASQRMLAERLGVEDAISGSCRTSSAPTCFRP